MDHPNIAKLYDAGVTPSGRPFFVMELIAGTPLTTYCRAHRLPVAARLDLFRQVCLAVQHAHLKGTLHRDLKPSNVLVAEHDGRPVPKVIDFGLAKSLAVGGPERPSATNLPSVVGTPEYMAPEQATFGPADVDTRADVFALGAVLYELLAGAPPRDGDRLRTLSADDMLRSVREDEPPAPSRRVRPTPDHPVRPAALRGDLDWIVRRAMARSRDCRYLTAQAVADDLLRHLRDEPVAAGPPTVGYRVGKLLRRHKGRAAVAAAVALALAMGIAGVGLGLHNTMRSRAAEQAAKDRAMRERDAAVAARDLTLSALQATTSDLIGATWSTQPGLSDDQRGFLEQVLPVYRRLLDEAAADDPARANAAVTARRVGDIEKRLGRPDRALAAYHQSVSDMKVLAAGHPADPDYRTERDRSWIRLADMYARLGRHAEAEGELRAMLADQPERPTDREMAAHVRATLALVLLATGRVTGAQAELRSAVAMLEKIVVLATEEIDLLANMRHNLGVIEQKLGRPAAAVIELQAAVTARSRLAAEHPAVTRPRLELAVSRSALGLALRQAGRAAEAETEYRVAEAGLSRLAYTYPTDAEVRQRLAEVRLNSGALYQFAGRASEAAVAYESAVSLLADYATWPTTEVGTRQTLADAHANLGRLHKTSGRSQAARDHFRAALELYDGLVARAPTNVEYAVGRGKILGRLVAVLRQLPVADALAEAADLVTRGPWDSGQLYALASAYAVASGQDGADKEEHALRAVELLRRAVARGWADPAVLAADRSFDAIRPRADYQQFVAGLPHPPVCAPLPRPSRWGV